MDRFSKFRRQMITIDGMHKWKILVLKIYFRFARENSKWPPKTTFSWITRELMNRFSKFQRHMITMDGMHMWKILVLKIYFRFARENSKWPPKTTFSWITRELMNRFSKLQRQMITIDSMHMRVWTEKMKKECAKKLCSKMFPFRIERDTPSIW